MKCKTSNCNNSESFACEGYCRKCYSWLHREEESNGAKWVTFGMIILALMFFAICAHGQDKLINLQHIMNKRDSCSSIIPLDFNREYLVVALTYFWDQYTQECYADSVYCELWRGVADTLSCQYIKTWQHNHKPDMPDFIVWLKKKRGVK